VFIIVTDVGQAQHFEMVFKAARASNLLSESTELRHVPFGLVQGEDGKKFKTRSGDTVRLKDLLDQAVSTAEEDMLARLNSGSKGENSASEPTEGGTLLELSAENKAVARIVGIGAVKYADLSMNRESNYRFSYRKMLSLTGNTAPYMLYAFARIQGIRRKALEAVAGGGEGQGQGENQVQGLQGLTAEALDLSTKEEQALAKQLMRLDEVLEEVSRDLYPNKLCEYIFELSQRFNQFYERCPVLAAESPELRKSRAALCSLTADTLKLSLDLLGIRTVEKL
jgi:arginyl-tRNA synthetase